MPLPQSPALPASNTNLNLLITGGAGFIGSNLVLELQESFPNFRLTVIDDFRSGDFKNLTGYKGDFVAQNLAELDWQKQFGDEKFDAIFHLASITDTTNHNQFEQVHDNVESFRRLLDFAERNKHVASFTRLRLRHTAQPPKRAMKKTALLPLTFTLSPKR